MEALPRNYTVWEVPYLPIDPKHVGRTYEAVIRVNSQSGKGGVAYIMKAEHGFDLPRRLQIEFSKTIQAITEDSGTEISPGAMWDAFRAEYWPEPVPYELLDHELVSEGTRDRTRLTAHIRVSGAVRSVTGVGNGPIAAFVDGLRRELGADVDVVDYAEHALGQGADATAVAYVETAHGSDGVLRWGVGVHPNIITASLMAVLSGLARGEHRRPTATGGGDA
jgi:2-isopropylmalate synthase